MRSGAMPRRSRSSSPAATTASDDGGPDHWPYLDEEQLQRSRGRRFCLSCQWFAHHPGSSCVPLLLCGWHQRQIVQGQHLSHRCASWREPLQQQQGWAPELG